MTTDVVSLDSVVIQSAPVLFRDCAFPITDLRKHFPTDDVISTFPVFIGRWEDNISAPAVLTQRIDVDTESIDGACTSATVKGVLTTCSYIAPNMKDISLATERLKLSELLPAFCKTRNISERQLGMVLNADGSINEGNPYAINFARFAASMLSHAFMELLTHGVLKGDYSNTFEVDGFYNQIDNGWDVPGSGACPTYLNKAQTFSWAVLTGGVAGTAVQPDAVTVSGKTVSLWGTTYNVPAGLTLAQFLEDFWFDKVEREYTEKAGGVDTWEIHIPSGTARCFLNSTACMQPCDISGEFDPDARARFAEYRKTQIAKLYPSGRALPMLESQYIAANTMYIGARKIGGLPTFGAFFMNQEEYMAALGLFGEQGYGQYFGLPDENEPLLQMDADLLKGNFENIAIQQTITRANPNCVTMQLDAKYGVLVTARHIWLKITDVTCPTFIDNATSDVYVDDVRLS